MADKVVVAPESVAPERHSVEAAAQAIAKLSLPPEKKKPVAKATTPAPEAPAPDGEEVAPLQVESSEELDTETPAPEAEETPDPEEPDDEEEPAPPRKLKVKVKEGDKDVETEVDEAELIKGYQRQQDYTRKTQSLAEERKKFAPETAAVRAERVQLAERLTTLEQVIKTATPPEPDWAKARAELTGEDFATLRADWDIHKERVAKIEAEGKQARAKVEHDQLEQFAEHLEQEKAKLLKAIPTWEKAEVAKAEKSEMADYALDTYGFTAEDMNGVSDHRILLVLRKAMMYDKRVAADVARLKAGKEKLAAAATITPKPGAPKVAGAKATKDLVASRKRLRETGSVSDAADTIKRMKL